MSGDTPTDWKCAHSVTLLTTSAYNVAEFRCPGVPATTSVERAPYPEIVLPRVGSYLRRDEAGEVLLNRTTLAFFEAERPYVIRHFRPAPDLTTVISITDKASLHDALGVQLPSGRTFSRSAIRMPPDLVLLHNRMLAELMSGAEGELAAQELAAGIILRALALNLRDEQELSRRRATAYRSDTFALAEAVTQFLELSYRGRVTLEQVARHVELSPFHLCRLFQAATGDTIHQHLLSIRLEASMRELLETDKSITEIAHAVGFSSHSHLTAIFTKTFGASPSKIRKQTGYPRKRRSRSPRAGAADDCALGAALPHEAPDNQ